MRKHIKKLLAISLVFSLLLLSLAGCGNGDSSSEKEPSNAGTPSSGNSSSNANTNGSTDEFEGKAIELKFAHNQAPTTPTALAIQAWCDDVYEATHGTVTITPYPSETLGATGTGLDMLDTGICDVFWATTGMFAGIFNYLDTFAMPMLDIDTAEEGTNAIWKTYEKWGDKMAGDFAGCKLLISYPGGDGIIGSNEPVTCAADLKGDVVRTISGGMAKFIEACGASPTFMSPYDIFTNLEKGVIDDYVFDWSGVESCTLGDITPYFLTMKAYHVPCFVIMSDGAWNKLSADQQAAIESVSYLDGSLAFARTQDEAQDIYVKSISDSTEMIVPSDEAYAEFVSIAEGVWADWVATLEDGEAYFADVQANIAATK